MTGRIAIRIITGIEWAGWLGVWLVASPLSMWRVFVLLLVIGVMGIVAEAKAFIESGQ